MKLLRRSFLSALFATLLVPTGAWAQNMQATITGGGGSGKCTFEVSVDGSAQVEIRNNQGSLRTTGGQRAQWRRLVCNQPLPRNPNNFRFRGIDGRGKQYLVRDPNSNGGTAVIRIEDNRNGFEGYTGDILWDGGGNSGGGWNGGGNNGGGWNGGGNNGGGWNGGGWNGGGNDNVSGSWTVQSAQYGSNNKNRDVTGNVRRLVNGPDFQVTNNNLGGDPAVGQVKTLRITARASNGSVRTFTYNEYATVNTRMFNGGGRPR